MAGNPDPYNPGREQVQVTAAPILQSEKARFDPEGAKNKLLEALGTESTQAELLRFNQQHEENKLKEQSAKIDFYVEQFQKDHAGGAVSQAQVKNRFPETVPIIAARVAESIGANEGRKQYQAAIDEVNSNDNLKLDSAARDAFLKQKRDEIFKTVGTGNDFYGAGLVGSMDKLTRQNEMNWQAETAKYHEKQQGEALSNEVTDALNSEEPQQALLNIDTKWSKSSSLNNLERNKIVVDSAIKLGFLNDDLEVFKKVPERFLNVDSKAQLEHARIQLVDRRMSDWRNAQALKTAQREEATRAAKTEIVGDVADGKPIDPAKYRGDPDQFTFALQMREAPRIDDSTSVAASQSFRHSILDQASAGKLGTSQADLQNAILAHPTMNPREKQKLIAELPELIQGTNVMTNPNVRQPFNDILAPQLHALADSPTGKTLSLVTGRNLNAEASQLYFRTIKRGAMAFYEKNGKWPVGTDLNDIVDGSVESTGKVIEQWANVKNMQSTLLPGVSAPAPAPAPKPAAPPAAPTGTAPALPKGVTLLSK